jgi:hypothetical protein
LKKKLLSLILFTIFILGVTGVATAWPGYMSEWEETDHGSCHNGTYVESTAGYLNITINPTGELDPGQQFNVTIGINAFTEAASKHVYVGISARLGDNHEFFLGVQNASTDALLEAYEVDLDASGNSNNTAKFVVYAPNTGGSYTLVLVALEGGESLGTVHPFDYVKAGINVNVSGVSSPPGIPGYDLFIIIGIGLITVVSISLLIRKKIRNRGVIE